MNHLADKRVLITAGPTWIAIDRVRVITNVFTGELGLLIAREFQKRKAKVTLLFGPGRKELIDSGRDKFKIKYFRYFEELRSLLTKEARPADVIINSAAISDYRPDKVFQGKIKSKQKSLILKFKPTIKLVDLVRKINPKAVLVKFKLEVDKTKKELIEKSRQSRLFSKADFIVANDYSLISDKYHQAYIMDNSKKIVICKTKQETAKTLADIINNYFTQKHDLQRAR